MKLRRKWKRPKRVRVCICCTMNRGEKAGNCTCPAWCPNA